MPFNESTVKTLRAEKDIISYKKGLEPHASERDTIFRL